MCIANVRIYIYIYIQIYIVIVYSKEGGKTVSMLSDG